MVTLPLLAAVIALPAGLDVATSPLAAGGIPLAWAAFTAIVARLNPGASAAAFAAALPFSAYSLAAFAEGSGVSWLFALTAAAAAASALTAAAGRQSAPARAAGRLHSALHMIIGAAPGLAIARYSSPWSGIAVSALVAAVSLLALERGRR